jgi:hypothetical protein
MGVSCTCGGRNDNCRFCFGTGEREPREAYSLVRNGRRTRISQKLQVCPVCGVGVRHLVRHLNRTHPGRISAPPSPRAAEAKSEIPKPVLLRPIVDRRTSVVDGRVRQASPGSVRGLVASQTSHGASPPSRSVKQIKKKPRKSSKSSRKRKKTTKKGKLQAHFTISDLGRRNSSRVRIVQGGLCSGK